MVYINNISMKLNEREIKQKPAENWPVEREWPGQGFSFVIKGGNMMHPNVLSKNRSQ